jgi:hypothetical protein
MAVGFPTKVTYANGDVFSAADVNDTNGTLNLLNPTAKGSIVSASAANTPSRLAVGTNNLVLSADSTATTGLAWKQQGMTLISSTTFSGATSVAIDNVFTSTYTNYVVEIIVTSGSGSAAQIDFRLRAGGTAATGSYYNSGYAWSYAGAGEAAAQNPASSAFVFRTAGGEWCGRLELFNPQAAQKTWWLGQYADTAQNGFRGGYYNAATSFDGFQAANSGGTNIAGSLRVYGWGN